MARFGAPRNWFLQPATDSLVTRAETPYWYPMPKSMITRRAALAKLAGGAARSIHGFPRPTARRRRSPVRRRRPERPHQPFGLPLVLRRHTPGYLVPGRAGMGIQSIDLVTVQDFPTLHNYGLICAMVTGVPGNIPNGLNRRETTTRSRPFSRKRSPSWPAPAIRT